MSTNVVELGNEEAKQTDILMRIRALTESKAVSASQIAKEISVSPATLSQILN
ncbi:DNA transposition protein, partial [Vibrio europaeus]|nr:DNA transposition protein [Vibrio europaeus]